MSDSVGTHAGSSDSREEERLAACFNCKRSKLKCVRPDSTTTCARCTQRRLACSAPLFHVGRHKGVKNKHSGLEKAVFQIEQALRRSQPGSEQIQSPEEAAELRCLLQRSRDLLSAERTHEIHDSDPGTDNPAPSASPRRAPTPLGTTPSSSQVGPRDNNGRAASLSQRAHEDLELSLDDAENPLQLLARTSELLSSMSQPAVGAQQPQPLRSKTLAPRAAPVVEDGPDGDLQRFFGRFRPRLDVGDDLDPVELGLVTLAEAEALFAYFHDRLAHTRWGIDPEIHTVDFVRSRSAFLLTSICAASALFTPSTEALHRRLSRHRQKLAGLVVARRFRSVEIVLALMVNIPWIPAGEHWADDETSTYMSMAVGIALDLSLNKVIILPAASAESPFSSPDSVATFDRISARRALALDGLSHVDPGSVAGRRFLRRRERTWLSLFVLERGVCLARGRSYVLPMSPLIENCDQWHRCDLADRWDGSIVSVAVLRRDLAKLILNVRAICDSYASTGNGLLVVERLKGEITVFFDRWYQTWPLQIGDREQLTLPPYVEILASHTRLSMYSSVINHATAPVAARHFFRAAGLSSALNVLRVAVQGEAQLRSMPNNTAIMISFAACFALRVSTAVADGHGRGSSSSLLAPSIRALIAETVDALERIGSTPAQRRGALSCLFAAQLRRILKLLASRSPTEGAGRSAAAPEPGGEEAAAAAAVASTFSNADHDRYQQQQQHAAGPPRRGSQQMPMQTSTTTPSDCLLFSTMSNDQLDEAIHNTDVGLDALWEDFQFQNASELDWMDWSTFEW
ncbi:hypothetical protein GGR56DRAFT_684413 [Xylariaceae sp. FL0804]|nr:hypothetical protein GGR56DRAFT_684413 [Xylariaceae sp. FL0804]